MSFKRILLVLILLVPLVLVGAVLLNPYLGVSVSTRQSDGGPRESVAAEPIVVRLFRELQRHHIEPKWIGESRVEWLRLAPGQAYQLGSEIDKEQLFIHTFPNSLVAQIVAGQIPKSADTGATDWIDDPHFFRCNAIIILYLGKDRNVITTLEELCGPQFAGKP